MKKTFYILLLVFEIFILFIANNTSSVLEAIQKDEVSRIMKDSEGFSKIIYPAEDRNKLKHLNSNIFFFDHIYISKVSPEKPVVYSNKDAYTLFSKKIKEGFLIFRKNSKTLKNLQQIKQFSNSLGIIFIIFLILTGITFLLQLRKKPTKSTTLTGIDPFNKYIDTLQQSESSLKTSLSVQEEQIKSKEQLNKNIIDNINTAIILLNESNRIEIFNNTAQIMFNHTYVKAKNELFQNVLKYFPEISQAIEKPDVTNYSEVESNNRFFLIDQRPLEKAGTLIIIKDITQEKISKRVSEKVNNFAMLGEMSTYLSHEIRNSLGVMYGYSKTLDKSNPKISNINLEIEHLSAMITKFLKFSKPFDIHKNEEVNLNDLLDSIALEIGIDLTLKGPRLSFKSDKALLKSAFLNLFLNSRQAGAQSLVITLKEFENENLSVFITDDGKGIDRQNREKIWYPFFTTREDGSGMGLPIVRKIITILNGEIDLLDNTQPGAQFRIRFYTT